MNNLIKLSILLLILATSCVKKQVQIDRPNILFAISDDQAFIHTGFNDCDFVKTPAFDRVAREGIYFSNCIAGSPGCAPSRSSIVTGRYHWQNEQSGQHASSWMKKYVPFVDVLNGNGYYTGRTGKGVAPFRYAKDENDSLWRKTDAAGVVRSNIKYKNADEKNANGISSDNYFENFKYFIDNKEDSKPFFFWYGCKEPHRRYEQDSWKRNGKKLEDAKIPEFYPESDLIRGDILDYAVEIDWFDMHLKKMLDYLEEIGELENTIVIVTADNGMPFPRAKANCYEYGIHVPLAIRYPKSFPGGRVIDNPVSFVDLAPTILELTQTESKGMQAIFGESMVDVLKSDKQGMVEDARQYAFVGRERHSSSRWKNFGYPQRAIRSQQYLLIWNMKPERWPAGAPQRLNPKNEDEVLPMYGIDSKGVSHSDWAFTDVDAAPTKSFLIENYKDEAIMPYFELSYFKRGEFELFDVVNDPSCLNDLINNPEYEEVKEELTTILKNELEKTQDPRLSAENEGIFDTYKRYSPIRHFPKPNWAK